MAYKIRNCKYCKKEFNSKQGNHIYCSERCRLIGYGAKFIKEEKRVCKKCNKKFIPNQHNQIYCSRYCGRTKMSEAIFICKICKKKFKPNNVNQKCCSNKCGKINKNNNWSLFYRSQKDYEPIKEVECVICNSIFLRYSIDQKTCSKECKLKYNAKGALERYYKNYDILKERRKKYYIKRKKEDKNYYIALILRSGLRDILNYHNTEKPKSVLELLGCTVPFLLKYLEQQFEEGMTWDNYGFYGWHIHHIRPCCTFDLSKEKEQKKCFHYTNLQPVWMKEHFSMKVHREHLTRKK